MSDWSEVLVVLVLGVLGNTVVMQTLLHLTEIVIMFLSFPLSTSL